MEEIIYKLIAFVAAVIIFYLVFDKQEDNFHE